MIDLHSEVTISQWFGVAKDRLTLLSNIIVKAWLFLGVINTRYDLTEILIEA